MDLEAIVVVSEGVKADTRTPASGARVVELVITPTTVTGTTTPVPDMVIVLVPLVWSVVNVMVPLIVPGLVGENLKVTLSDPPGGIEPDKGLAAVCGVTPLLPEMPVIVIAPVPLLRMVTTSSLERPTRTSPKVRFPSSAITRVAGVVGDVGEDSPPLHAIDPAMAVSTHSLPIKGRPPHLLTNKL